MTLVRDAIVHFLQLDETGNWNYVQIKSYVPACVLTLDTLDQFDLEFRLVYSAIVHSKVIVLG